MSGDKPVVLLVDAINESSYSENIKQSLRKLLDQLPNLRVLLTGQTALASSEHATIININSANIKGDIDTFILSRLHEDGMLKGLNSKLKHEIRQTISQKADGSSVPQSDGVFAADFDRFRWTQLSLENLSTQRTSKAIREALQILPGTLRETYVSILQRIPANDWELSRTALLWLCFSNRSLTLDELNEAVILEEKSTILDEDMKLVYPEILLEICQGLISQDELGKVHLAHASVKDFLTSDWIRFSNMQYFSLDPVTADKTLMRQCLTYLCLDNFRSGHVPSIDDILEREKEHPLLEYAAHFWASHAHSQDFNHDDHHMVKRLFGSRQLTRCGNFGVFVQTLAPEIEVERVEATQPLYYAASFGLAPVVEAILESATAITIDAPGGRFGSTPLYIACWRGHHDVLELLLQAGADPYQPDASTDLTVFSLPSTLKSTRMKEILSETRLKDHHGPTIHATSEDISIGTREEAERRSVWGNREESRGESNEGHDPLGANLMDIDQKPARNFAVALLCDIPAQGEFLAHVLKLYPRLEPGLAQRFAQEQCRRYERLAMLRQKHSQDVINHSCRSGEYCTAPGNAAIIQHQREFVSSQKDGFTPCDDQGGGIDPDQFPSGVPLPPVRALPAQFECPICFEVKKPSDWTKHVHQDVQPFTCIFRDCSEPKSFKRQADWVRHEFERHRQPDYYQCSFPECGITFSRKHVLIQHLIRAHGLPEPNIRDKKLPEDLSPPERSMEGLWEIVEQSSRKTDISQGEQCVFCGKNFETWKKWMVHLGKHLVELAMPVLEMVERRVAS